MGYRDIEIPERKDPEDYTYHERRSELLEVVIEAGHPDRISRTQMGQRYDVDHSTISRDIDAIRDEISEDLNDDARFVSSVIYRKAIKEKIDDKDWDGAVEILESWNDWLFDVGEQEKAADKLDIQGDPGEAYLAALKDAAGDDDDE